MTNKSVLFLAIMLSCLALTYAADFSVSQPSTLSISNNFTQFSVSNSNLTESVSLTIKTPINIADEKGNTITVTPSESSFSLSNLSSKTINLSASAIPTGFSLGQFSTPIIIYASSNVSNNVSTTLNYVKSYCTSGNTGNALEITKITDEELDNDDSWKWSPLDNVEITVKVHNSYSDDLDVVVEYGLYNPSTREFLDIDSEEIDVSIDEGESEEVTITFAVPSDVDERSDYRFYIKAYDEGNEKIRCVDVKDGEYFQDLEISRDSRAVTIDNIRLDSTATCGDNLELKARISNIGKSDEEKVLVSLFNRELGINLVEVLDDLDNGDQETVTFNFRVPTNATQKTYTLEFMTRYRYDDDNSGCSNDEDIDCYDDNNLDDLDKSFTTSFQVSNCAVVSSKNAAIAAALQTSSDMIKEGKEVVIKASITNTGNEITSYVVDLEGEESFAVVQNINPLSVNLNPGETKDVLVTLKLNAQSSGEHLFTIKALFGDKEVRKQVALSVPESASSISNIISSIRGNWFIWAIVIVNIILIIAIIIVAVKVTRN